MKLSFGPLLYYWSREDTLAFYEAAATWPVDCIYLGETVCSRRHLLRLADWLELAERLAATGKEVVLSSQTLIESESDLKALRKLIADEEGGLIAKMAAGGIQVTRPDLAPFRAKMGPAYTRISSYAGEANVKKFLELVDSRRSS